MVQLLILKLHSKHCFIDFPIKRNFTMGFIIKRNFIVNFMDFIIKRDFIINFMDCIIKRDFIMNFIDFIIKRKFIIKRNSIKHFIHYCFTNFRHFMVNKRNYQKDYFIINLRS